MLSEQQQRIMGYFIEEAKDHLNTIEQGLVNLRSTIADSEMVHEVFRAAHSVKGGAAMLGLGSIQHTAHRLEDYFKVLKECPQVQVDQKLETLFLRIYDTLHELVDQLQGPFGLTDDKAQEAMANAEPIFTELSQHLSVLVEQVGGTPPEDVELMPFTSVAQPPISQPSVQPAVAEESVFRFIFQNDVPARLRDMLQLFKQAECPETRQQLQELCRRLAQPGEQFNLPHWCDLLAKVQQAIANRDNTYRTLAPIVIKDVKRAQELILLGRSTEVSPCQDLLNLLPQNAEIEVASDDLALAIADLFTSTDEGDQNELTNTDLGELVSVAEQSASLFEEEFSEPDSADNWFSSEILAQDNEVGETSIQSATVLQEEEDESPVDEFTLSFDPQPDPSSFTSHSANPELPVPSQNDRPDESIHPLERSEHTGPGVGSAELNSLADLFEGELPDLGLTWQEEEEISALTDSPEFSELSLSNDFSDLLFEDSSEALVFGEEEEDLSGLLNAASLQNSSQPPPTTPIQSALDGVPESSELADGSLGFPPIEQSDSDDMAMFFMSEDFGEMIQASDSAETMSPGKAPSQQNLDELFLTLEASTTESFNTSPSLTEESEDLAAIFTTPETDGMSDFSDRPSSEPEDDELADLLGITQDSHNLLADDQFENFDNVEDSASSDALIDQLFLDKAEDTEAGDADIETDIEAASGSNAEIFCAEDLMDSSDFWLTESEPETPEGEAVANEILPFNLPDLPEAASPPVQEHLDPERLSTASSIGEEGEQPELTGDEGEETGNLEDFFITEEASNLDLEALDLTADAEFDMEAFLGREDESLTPERTERTDDGEAIADDLSDLFGGADIADDIFTETDETSTRDTSEEAGTEWDSQLLEAAEVQSTILESPSEFKAAFVESNQEEMVGQGEPIDEFLGAEEFAFDLDAPNAEDPALLNLADAEFAELSSNLSETTSQAAETSEVSALDENFLDENFEAARFDPFVLEFEEPVETKDIQTPEETDFDSDFHSDLQFTDLGLPEPEMSDAGADDFSDLGAMFGEGGIASEPFAGLDGVPSATEADEFANLEAMLEENASAVAESSSTDDFADLEALLGDELPAPRPPSGMAAPVVDRSPAPAPPAASEHDDEFGDLEALLQEADQKLGVGSSPARSSASVTTRRPSRRNVIADQTMRVSVKHLDNLNNLVGEMVVNRNSLEQAQERLRQFLDNLLYQVQQLSDVGQRMRDLYERSLLESSLLSSRRSYNLSGGSSLTSSQTSHATGASFDALEMDRFTGFHTLSQEMIELIVRVRESASDIDFVVEESDQVTRNFRQITTQLQEGLTRSRMVPFAQTADRLPRGVRDNAIKYGKQAELVIEGRDTLIDKMIVEQLYDPMTHLVNNAIAHGIETPEERIAAGKPPTGRIVIRAFHQGNQTVISVSDDGAGINTESVKAKAIARGLITSADAQQMSRLEIYDLLFQHGFSTVDKADDLRGRGVGLDVVRSNLSEIRGAISIDSAVGKGTTFTIRLPLTLSISKALCCISNRARIAFPMDGVEDMLDVPKDRIQTDEQGQSCIQWRDALLPFQPLSELLKYNRVLGRGSVYGGNQEEDMLSIVVLRSAGNYLALQVDQVLGEQEIVIKQLEGPVPKPIGVAGATVLGDGRIMPIADVLELIDLSQGRIRREANNALWETSGDHAAQEPSTTKTEPTVLIVDDSITVRELLSMTFNKVGYRVEQARDGQEAWEKLRSGLPCDLVFCDIEMPRMDGLELLSRLQKDPNLGEIPVAMLTSRGADRHRQMAVQLGAKGYFTKPYLEEVLLDAAQRMLKGEVLVANSTGNS